MKHAILLLWHTDVKQLLDLTNCFDEDFTFYIHIDKRSKEDIRQLKQKNNIHIFRKYKIHWGGFNILKAELLLLRKIVENNKNYAYIHFFSGQDYPIKNLQYIKNFFIVNVGKEFIHYMKIPSIHWEKGTYDRYLYYPSFAAVCTINSIKVVKYQQISAK